MITGTRRGDTILEDGANGIGGSRGPVSVEFHFRRTGDGSRCRLTRAAGAIRIREPPLTARLENVDGKHPFMNSLDKHRDLVVLRTAVFVLPFESAKLRITFNFNLESLPLILRCP